MALATSRAEPCNNGLGQGTRQIRFEQSTPYVHEELGNAERGNQKWSRYVRTMLIRALMGVQHYATAAKHAVWHG